MSERWLDDFDLTQLEGRKGTFHENPDWDPSWAAAEGWYYTGHENVIQCVSCQGQLRMPLSEAEIRDYHCVFFPWCDLLNERIVQQDRLREIQINDKKWNTVAQIIQYPLANPRIPHMAAEGTRSRTFSFKVGCARAKVLAKAGLYKMALNPSLQCYYCGMRLNWQKLSENIAMAHVRNSPDCEHMKRLLGYPTWREIQTFYGAVADPRGDVTDKVPTYALDQQHQAQA